MSDTARSFLILMLSGRFSGPNMAVIKRPIDWPTGAARTRTRWVVCGRTVAATTVKVVRPGEGRPGRARAA